MRDKTMPGAAPASTQHAHAAALATQLQHWLRQHLLPLEPELLANEGNAHYHHLLEKLREQAQQQGWFGLFYPPALGGKITDLSAYLALAEVEGYSEFGPAITGLESTLDIHMLQQYGSASVQQRFLPALASGAALASYAMSEPACPGSLPQHTQSQARLIDGHWHIQAHKWFICRAEKADLFTVLVQSVDADGGQGLSMLIVPRAAPGCSVPNSMPVLGRQMGQAEVRFENVVVPADYLLGARHQGAQMMQARLGLGRILRSSQWLGLAQRSYDMLCSRILSPRAASLMLADKQLIRAKVFASHQAISSARALLQQAAQQWQTQHVHSMLAINSAKLAASHALCLVADHALQVHGAEGLLDHTPISAIYRHARCTRMMDGADEALINAVGKQLLRQFQDDAKHQF